MTVSSQDIFVDRFVRSQGRIYAYIASMLPNRGDAEEVFQQTSLVLWRKRDQYDPARDFCAWACGISHYEIRNFLRHSDRRHVSLSEDVLDLVGATKLAVDADGERRLQALQACLQKLPQAQSNLIQRFYEGGHSTRNICERIGITPTNLYVRLHRIRRALVQCIEGRLKAEGKP